MLGRLLGWIATPPEGVHLSEDEIEVYAVTLWATLIGLVAHTSWVPLFGFLGFTELAILNVGSTLCFVAAVWLCRRGKMTGSLVFAAIEVVAHAWAATYYLWVALIAVSPLLEPAYEIAAGVESFFLVVNGVVFVSVLAGITLYHSWRVTLTRDSRKQAQDELSAAVEKTQVIVAQMADGLVAFGRT